MTDPKTPNFGFTKPVVSTTPDTTWASELNTNFDLADAVLYGSGSPVPASGLNVNADVSWQGNNLTALRAARFNSQVGTLGGSNDKNEIYVVNGDAYFNNSAGTAVRLTNGSQLATTGSTGTFATRSVSSDLAIPANAAYNTLLVNTTAIRNLTLPAASAVAAGKTFFIEDVSGNANAHQINLVPAGSDTVGGVAATMSLNQAFGSWIVTSDGSGGWWVNQSAIFSWGKTQLLTGSVTRTLIQPCQTLVTASGWANNIPTGGSGFGIVGPGTSTTQVVKIDPANIHDGATLNTITLNFAVGQSHTGVPAVLPSFQAFRHRNGTEVSLGSAVTAPTPGSGALWFNAGAQQTLTLTCTTNNVIDRSQDIIFVLITDESSTNAHSGNVYNSLSLTFGSIPAQWWP